MKVDIVHFSHSSNKKVNYNFYQYITLQKYKTQFYFLKQKQFDLSTSF